MHDIFTELSLIIAIGAGISLVMRLIRQPLIIGHIITGIIVGPALLNLTKSPDTIEVFSTIGIALLLFIIGLGLNPKVIKEVGKVAGIAGIIQVVAIGAIGWIAGLAFGFSKTEALFLGVALSFSSTIIILKLLSDKKEQGRLYGKIAIGILLIQDILATFALLFVTAKSSGETFQFSQLATLAGKGALIIVPLFLVSYQILPRLHKLIAGSQEFLFLFAIGWGFGIAALFEKVGFSVETGALVAGISLAGLPYAQEISARLRPLRDFFVVVFFIVLGTQLTFGNFTHLLPIIIASSVIVIIAKPFVVMVLMGLMGYTKRTSFKASIALAQVSEFSLVLMTLGFQQKLIRPDLVTIMTFVALITIAVSSYLIIYSDKIYSVLEDRLGMFERRKTHFEQAQRSSYELLLFGYQKGGHEFVRTFQSLKKRYVVVDYDPDVVDVMEHNKINYMYGDATDIELLEEVGFDKSRLIVSTITDQETNIFLLRIMNKFNPNAIFICHANNPQDAAQLYELGASYVMLPHYIGSEKIGAFIRRSGLKKSEFKAYRERHLQYLQTHYAMFTASDAVVE